LKIGVPVTSAFKNVVTNYRDYIMAKIPYRLSLQFILLYRETRYPAGRQVRAKEVVVSGRGE